RGAGRALERAKCFRLPSPIPVLLIRASKQAYRASAIASGNQNASIESSTPETMPRIAASASSLRSRGPDDAAASQRLMVNAAAVTGVIGSSSVVVFYSAVTAAGPLRAVA